MKFVFNTKLIFVLCVCLLLARHTEQLYSVDCLGVYAIVLTHRVVSSRCRRDVLSNIRGLDALSIMEGLDELSMEGSILVSVFRESISCFVFYS